VGGASREDMRRRAVITAAVLAVIALGLTRMKAWKARSAAAAALRGPNAAVVSGLRELLWADQGLREDLAREAAGDPEAEEIRFASAGGRCEDAVRRTSAQVGASASSAGSLKLLAFARDACGDRPGAVEAMRGVLELASESRQALQAWHHLRALGVEPGVAEARRVLGVIVEIGAVQGTDTVAAYADRSTRFFSRAGGMSLGDDHRPEVEDRAAQLIAAAGRFLDQTSPPSGPRQLPPPGTVQFTLLTPSGPRTASAPLNALLTGQSPWVPLFEPAAKLLALKVQGG